MGAKLLHAERLRRGRLARAELKGPGVCNRDEFCGIKQCVFEILKYAGFAAVEPILPPELSSVR